MVLMARLPTVVVVLKANIRSVKGGGGVKEEVQKWTSEIF